MHRSPEVYTGLFASATTVLYISITFYKHLIIVPSHISNNVYSVNIIIHKTFLILIQLVPDAKFCLKKDNNTHFEWTTPVKL